MPNTPNRTPEEQLQALEDAYAELLLDDVDAHTLSQLWNHIKELRRLLTMPIYENVTPAELRQ